MILLYQNRQIGWLSVGLVCAVAVGIVAPSLDVASLPVLIIGVLVIVALSPFTSMVVTVTPQTLEFAFLFGFMRNRVPIESIVGTAVRPRALLASGIRHTRRGLAWSVGPGDAVELSLRDGQVLWVGSNDAERLCEAIKLAQSAA